MREGARLNVIAEYSLHKSEEDESLSELMMAVAQLLHTPIALVSVIGEHEQFFKGKFGVSIDSTRREDSFCKHVVAQDAPFIVEDTYQDAEYAVNPLVTESPNIRFYAGVPLRLNHATIGAVCVLDNQPRTISQAEIKLLEKVSHHVSHYLSLVKEHLHLQQEHTLLDNAPAVLFKWQNIDGMTLTYVSNNIGNLFNLPASLLLQKKIRLEQFIVDDGIADFHTLFQHHLAGRTHGETQFQLQSPLDKTYWVKLISRAFFTHNGDLVSIHAMLIDHTDNQLIENKLSQSHAQLKLLLEASNLGTWDWHVARGINQVNERWCEMLGLEQRDIEPSYEFWRERVHPADLAHIELALSQHLANETQLFNTTYRMRHQAGHWVWIETYGRVVEHDTEGAPCRLAGTHRDITAKKEAALLESRQQKLIGLINQLQTAYLNTPDLFTACQQVLPGLLSLTQSELGVIVQLSDPHSSQPCQLLASSSANHVEPYQWLSSSALTQLITVLPHHEDCLHYPSGNTSLLTQQALALSATPLTHFLGIPLKLKGEIVGLLGLANRPTEYHAEDAQFLSPFTDALTSLYYAVEQERARLLAEQKLKNLAMTDVLTGIPNRRAFMEMCAELHTYATPFTLAIMDIDRFKTVNDTYGHAAGDEAIKHIGRSLQGLLRSDDYAARMGGEEFAVLIEGLSQSKTAQFLEKIRQHIADHPVIYAGETIPITVSIGARFVNEQAERQLDNLISEADKALYRAKAEGRNRVVWYGD